MSNRIDRIITKVLLDHEMVDPITLSNTILNHSMRRQGYEWINQAPHPIDQKEVLDAGPFLFNKSGGFKLSEGKEETPQVPVETNVHDPAVQSTDPQFNACPAYLNGVCRLTGKPCVFSNKDYKDCGIYHLAKTGIPNLFEIPPGKENDQAYIHGTKA